MALFALLMNLALSFGHVHAPYGGHEGEPVGAIVSAIAALFGSGSPTGHHDDGHPDDLCPICMAAAVIGNGIAPTAPVLAVQFTEAIADHFVAPVVTLVSTQRAAFQSRAPPVS